MSKDFHLLEEYKGVKLYYGNTDGRVHFNFEGSEQTTTYLFEAHRVIDEPKWEPFKAFGYYIEDFSDHIGTAKAERRDIKSGKPEWQYKGKYDLHYRPNDFWKDGSKVCPQNDHTNSVYKRFQEQKKVVDHETQKLKDIIGELK